MHQFFHALEARRLLSDNALSFDGSNDFVDFGDNHLDLGQNATIEMKVNFKALPAFGKEVTFISKGTGDLSWSFGFERRTVEGFDVSGWKYAVTDSQHEGSIGGGWDEIDQSPVLNHWYHIALVKTDLHYKIHIDQADDTNQDGFVSIGPPDTTAPLRIGISPDGTKAFNGLIDEVRVWGTARTAAQINANRDKTLTGSEPGLIGYWDFNEALDSQVALDKTASHKDGRLGSTTGVDTADPVRVVVSGSGGGGNNASIAGTLFNDGDKDGVLDATDARLAGKKMYLDANSNGKFDAGEVSTTTNASGVYSLTGLAAGTHRVGRADTPAGYSFSTPTGGIWVVTLAAGQSATGKNFGVFQGSGGGGGGGGNTGSISGTLFNDANKNGALDAGESILSARKIYIDANSNSKFDAGEVNTTTNASGVYSFTGLAAGTYRVGRADTPAGYSFSTPVGGIWVVTLGSAQSATGKNFGVFQGSGVSFGAIAGIVFSDNNKNGLFDAGDTTLAGKKIYLDKNKNGVLDAGDISVLSSAAGVYSFTGLAAGTYRVRRADLPAGYKLSVPSTGFYDMTISAGQLVTGKNIGAVPI